MSESARGGAKVDVDMDVAFRLDPTSQANLCQEASQPTRPRRCSQQVSAPASSPPTCHFQEQDSDLQSSWSLFPPSLPPSFLLSPNLFQASPWIGSPIFLISYTDIPLPQYPPRSFDGGEKKPDVENHRRLCCMKCNAAVQIQTPLDARSGYCCT